MVPFPTLVICEYTNQSLTGDSPPRPSTLSEVTFGVLVTREQHNSTRRHIVLSTLERKGKTY